MDDSGVTPQTTGKTYSDEHIARFIDRVSVDSSVVGSVNGNKCYTFNMKHEHHRCIE